MSRELSNRERLERLGRRILAASRNDIYLSMRFLDIALGGLGYQMNLNTVSVGTDGVDILFNPTYLKRVYQEDMVELNRVYLHMVLHCMLRHEINRAGRDEELWTVACDIAVESILDGIENRAVQMMVSSYREDVYDWLKESCPVLTAEAVYRTLVTSETDGFTLLKLKQAFYRDDHQFWLTDDKKEQSQDKQSKGSDDGSDREQQKKREQIEQNWKHIDQKTQTNLETFFASHGDEMGDLLTVIRVENRERWDYRTFLQRFVTMREEVKADPDSFDYAFYNYGLQLYGTIPLIEPLEYQESRKIKDFVIVLDTSDSCSEGIVERFLSETRAVLHHQQAFFERINLHIIQSDAGIQSDTVLHSAEEFERYCDAFVVRGSGGTDFRPAFDYVAQLQQRGELSELKGLLYFTDGFGTYPSHKPPYETAFVFFREDYTVPTVPAWAIRIVLGSEELSEQYPEPCSWVNVVNLRENDTD